MKASRGDRSSSGRPFLFAVYSFDASISEVAVSLIVTAIAYFMGLYVQDVFLQNVFVATDRLRDVVDGVGCA